MSAGTSSLRCSWSRWAGSSGSDLASEMTPSSRPCLAEMLPDARTETLPGLDHLARLTHPAELASAIGAFASHPAPAPS